MPQVDKNTALEAFGKNQYQCCTPLTPASTPYRDCADQSLAQEKTNEDYEIERRLAALADSMERHYVRMAMRGNETFVLAWSEPLSHFTLFYHDQSGQVIKTVPPKGVIPLSNAQAAEAANYRNGTRTSPVYPAHNDGVRDTLSTVFRYNALGQAIFRETPDGGITKYYYDEVGRAVGTQDAVLLAENQLAFNLYDAQNRITEAGMMHLTAGLLAERTPNSGVITYARLAASTGAKTEVYRTCYNESCANTVVKRKFAGGAPKKLRGRVASQTYAENGRDIDFASHMSYDIAGNMKEFVQEMPRLGTEFPAVPDITEQSIKQQRYKYDLITGRVRETVYQPGAPDQFYHWFQYDADNRIIAVQTATHRYEAQDLRDQDATYHYYLHGPLARAELGKDHIQGLDMAYTLQGKLKLMNSISSTIEADPGHDGLGLFATDALAYALQYYPSDYKPIGRLDVATGTSSVFGADGPAQYNGNISALITRNTGLDIPILATSYQYDQMGRLRDTRCFQESATSMSAPSANTNNGLFDAVRDFSWRSMGDRWRMQIDYDKNGNITTINRRNETGAPMDAMAYTYAPETNKLMHIRDGAGQLSATGSVVDMPTNSTYRYDEKGRLTRENTDELTWSATDKLKMYSSGGRSTQFKYDAFGRRYLKKGSDGNATITVRDISGNIISTYAIRAGRIYWQEVPLYASGRFGTWQPDTLLAATPPSTGPSVLGKRFGFYRGEKAYELTQHTGEVMAVVTDRRLPVRVGTNATWTVDYIMAQDYYAFGMPMPGRTRLSTYRFGFQGMERDDDLKGNGNSYTTEFRQYDPRVGRWLSLDPMMDKYPGVSPYVAMMNNPIHITDEKGNDALADAIQTLRTDVNGHHVGETIDVLRFNPQYQRNYVYSMVVGDEFPRGTENARFDMPGFNFSTNHSEALERARDALTTVFERLSEYFLEIGQNETLMEQGGAAFRHYRDDAVTIGRQIHGFNQGRIQRRSVVRAYGRGLQAALALGQTASNISSILSGMENLAALDANDPSNLGSRIDAVSEIFDGTIGILETLHVPIPEMLSDGIVAEYGRAVFTNPILLEEILARPDDRGQVVRRGICRNADGSLCTGSVARQYYYGE